MEQPLWNPQHLDELLAHWKDIISACELVNREAATLLYITKPCAIVVDAHVVILQLQTRFAFHRDRLLEPEIRSDLERLFYHLFQKPVSYAVQLDALPSDSTTTQGDTMPSHTYYRRSSYGARPGVRRTGRRSVAPGGIRAIPTTYAGITFRSKLEATTAQTFDEERVRWQYEVEGYDLQGIWYLPDFYLPDMRTFVEVKGVFDRRSEEKVFALAEACEAEDIQVILLFEARKRRVNGYYTVVADRVFPDRIEKESMFLLRCPQCEETTWVYTTAQKTSGICRLCAHTSKKFAVL